MTASTSPISGAEARRAARNVGAIAAARILSSAALLIWQLILVRLLGSSDFGIVNTVTSLFAVGVTLTTFGISAIYIRDVARAPQEAGRYAAASLTVQTLLALLAYIGISGVGLALGYESTIRAFAAIGAISLFVDLTGNVGYDTLLARERMAVASFIDVAHIAARILLAGAALALGFGLLGLYVMTIVSGLGRAAAMWIALSRDHIRPLFPVERRIAWALILGGAPLAISGFINQLYTQLDKLMTTSILTTTDTGHLGAAFVIVVGAVEILSTTVIVAVFPIMSRLFTPGQPLESEINASFRMLIEKLAFFSLLIVIPMGLIVSLFSPAITVPLFGEDFAPTADLLRVLIWYASIAIVGNIYAQGLIAMNRQRTLLIVRSAGLIGKLSLNLLLLPQIGVIGAATASLAAEVLVLFGLFSAYRGGGHARAVLPQVIRALAAGVISAAVMIFIGAFSPIFGMIAGGAAYLIAVLLLGTLRDDDWDLLYRLAAAMPGGALIRRFWKRDTPLNW